MARDSSTDQTRSTRRRGCRRAVVVAIVLVIILVVAALAIEIGRRSETVGQIIVGKIQQATGLLTTAGKIEVSWGGTTVIENLEFSMPLSDEPALRIDRLEVEHEMLPLVILKRSLSIDSVSVRHPVVLVTELADPDGKPDGWSVQRTLDRVRASAGGQSGGGEKKPLPDVPEVSVTEGELILASIRGERITLPFTVKATPTNALALEYEATVEGLLHASGEASVGADWTHAVDFRMDPDAELYDSLRVAFGLDELAQLATAPTVQGAWAGRMTPEGLTGSLKIEHATAAEFTLDGALALQAGDVIAVEPDRIRIVPPGAPEVLILGGEITLEESTLRISGVEVNTAEQIATLDGSMDIDAMEGRADLAFRGSAGEFFRHFGSANLTVRTPAGRPEIVGEIRAEGAAPEGDARLHARLRAEGRDWQHLNIAVDAPSLAYEAGESVWEADGLALALRLTPDRLILRDAALPNTQSSFVRGDIAFDRLTWSLDADLDRWRPAPSTPIADVRLTARGEGTAIHAWTLDASEGGTRLTGEGLFDPAQPKPLAAQLELTVSRDAPVPAAEAEPPITPRELTGDVAASFQLAGTLNPIELEGQAVLRTRGVTVGPEPVEDLDITGAARFDAQGGQFVSEQFGMLNGIVTANADTDWRGNVSANLEIEGLALGPLTTLLDVATPVEGIAGAVVDVTVPQGDTALAEVTGRWTVTDLSVGPLVAERGEGQIGYARDVVELHHITLTNGGGDIIARATVPLHDLASVVAAADAESFLITLGSTAASFTGHTEGIINLLDQSASLQIEGAADVAYQGHPVGVVQATGQLDQRTIRFETIDGLLGGGTLTGNATIPLDELATATADLTLDALEPRSFSALFPAADELAGRVSGRLTLGPAPGPNAPGPSRLDLDLDVGEGSWRGIGIEGLNAVAFIGPERSTLETFVARVGSGSITAWGATNVHAGDRYLQLAGDISRVELNQIVGAVSSDADEYQGLVSASFGGGGYISETPRLFGQATVTIVESDLVNIPLISSLYSALSVTGGGSERNGQGIADIRVEGNALRIPRAQYFNRGMEVRASLDIGDIFRGGESPIAGIAVGTARPLSGGDTLLTNSADRLLSAAQEGGTVIRINGTLGEPAVRVVPLADLQNFVGRVFGPLGG